jgi:hypothetical protein
MEITKERLIQISKTNASAKVMIKQWYPSIFEDGDSESSIVLREVVTRELEIGKWYTDGGEHLMIFSGNTFNCKGFYNYNWNTNWLFPNITTVSLASEQQIGDALRRHCRRTGYTSSNFTPIGYCTPRDYPIESWHYEYYTDSLYAAPEGLGGLCVYKNGAWAQLNSQIEF